MNYISFISKYPYIDLILELFKGVAPTIVALLAIRINNDRANKRDLRKQTTDIKINTLLKLEEHVINFNNVIYDVGKEFLDYMQWVDKKDKKDRYFDLYYENNKTMLIFARKIMFLSESAVVKTGAKNIEFHSYFEKVSTFSYEMTEIMNEYEYKVENANEQYKNKLLDEVQKKLIISTQKLEEALLEYTYILSYTIKEMSEIN